MLIEFTVENFRSFAEAQTLSMIAAGAADSSHPQNVVEKGGFRLLKAAALYGANASGKSNLIKAFQFMERFVRESATKMNLGDPIRGIEPFKLHPEWRNRPSSFAVRLILEGTEYQYGFSATRERVHDEWLHVKREGGRVTHALQRAFDTASGETRWNMRGELKAQGRLAREATRDNGLFLSHAAQMNIEYVKALYLWFRNHLWGFDLSTPRYELLQRTARRVSESQIFRKLVEALLHDADLGISRLAVKKEDVKSRLAASETRSLLENTPDELRGFLSSLVDVELYTVRAVHEAANMDDPVEFLLEEEESNGTQRFFAIIGPVLESLARGDLIVVDELDCSMHPLLTRKLVELFQSAEANRKGAQLVFATHDSTLMTPALFRRDQIWLCEKNKNCATELFSLSDVEPPPRKTEAFERNYLAGRYGGVPSFGPALEDFEVR
jgi:uncharacterized protein